MTTKLFSGEAFSPSTMNTQVFSGEVFQSMTTKLFSRETFSPTTTKGATSNEKIKRAIYSVDGGGTTSNKKIKGAACYYVDEEILCDILSRLPLKSLVRFKCVCKSWQSLIEKDQWLINLHHTRELEKKPCLSFLINKTISKRSCLWITNLTMVFPHDESGEAGSYYCTEESCMDTNHEEITTATRTIRAISNKALLVCKQVQKPINGMICLIDKEETEGSDRIKKDHAACLYNVITQEATPWIKSTYLDEIKQWYDVPTLAMSRAYEFGFDPTTKEYKVICMWSITGFELQKFEGYGEYKETVERDEDDGSILGYSGDYSMCEILTLGKDTAWRRINDKAPPSNKCDKEINGSVSANGSIYWMVYEDLHYVLVAFDVGCEEYRVIPDLDFIGLDRPEAPDSFYLMELDGHLAIVKRADNHTVNLWKLDDDRERNINTANTSNIKWTKEIIMLPLCWRYHNVRFHVVEGTEYLIVGLLGHLSEEPVSVHTYNRKKKTFGNIFEINGDESPYSCLGANIDGDESPYSCLGANIGHLSYKFSRYVESLLVLQRSYRPARETPDSSSTNNSLRLSNLSCKRRARRPGRTSQNPNVS